MSYKIGDKIELKKPKQEKKEQYDEILRQATLILKNNKIDESEKVEVSHMLLDILENWFLEEERESCLYAKKKLIPILYELVNKSSLDYMSDFFDIYKLLYEFSARRDFECFIDCMEWDMAKKVYGKRREILASYVWALDKCAFDPKLEWIVASFPPSIGKSYILNLFTAWSYGLSINHANIRMSYSDELVRGFSRTVKSYLMDEKFARIFKNFAYYGGKPFDVEKESDWTIKNAVVPKSNLVSRPRGGTINGERANFAFMFDDMTKGREEANNTVIHQQIYETWTTDWYPRRTDDPITYIFIGTQWCPEDILNRIIDDREAVSPLIPHPKFKYTWVSEDGSTVVIKVPMLDENGKTTCPAVYPQERAEQIQKTTEPFLFSCVYQQNPIAPTGREFAEELLLHYDKLPLNEDGTPAFSTTAYAVLDPARKGKDNVSMPICVHGDDDYYYMTDCLFKQKPMTDLYDEIIDKIIENNVVEFVVENNIDVSLKTLLNEKLVNRGYNLCTIKEKYNAPRKEQRIKDARGIVRSRIKFKNKTDYLPNSDYGRFMKNLNEYSFDYPAKFDDAPDSISMMASEIIAGNGMVQKVQPIDRREYGI